MRTVHSVLTFRQGNLSTGHTVYAVHCVLSFRLGPMECKATWNTRPHGIQGTHYIRYTLQSSLNRATWNICALVTVYAINIRNCTIYVLLVRSKRIRVIVYCGEPAISHDSHHVSLVRWTNLFASRHKGHRFKSPGGYLCGTEILLLALSRYSTYILNTIFCHGRGNADVPCTCTFL